MLSENKMQALGLSPDTLWIRATGCRYFIWPAPSSRVASLPLFLSTPVSFVFSPHSLFLSVFSHYIFAPFCLLLFTSCSHFPPYLEANLQFHFIYRVELILRRLVPTIILKKKKTIKPEIKIAFIHKVVWLLMGLKMWMNLIQKFQKGIQDVNWDISSCFWVNIVSVSFRVS